jgi:pyruvate formate lyase activating enzyme
MSSLLTDPEIRASHPPVRILGWSKTTLLDFPGNVASTLFLEGCNFRCPFCHNPDLVLPEGEGRQVSIDLEEILSYLATYSRMLEGVCLTGGEPLLQAGLAELCKQIRGLGLQIKLDTNGSLPERLEPLLDASLLDYVAMDIKGPPAKLTSIAGTGIPEDALIAATEATIGLLQAAAVRYELRTTVVPGLLDESDLFAMGEWLEGGHRFVLQQFRPGKTLDPIFQDLPPYPAQFLNEQASKLSTFFLQCEVRGLG